MANVKPISFSGDDDEDGADPWLKNRFAITGCQEFVGSGGKKSRTAFRPTPQLKTAWLAGWLAGWEDVTTPPLIFSSTPLPRPQLFAAKTFPPSRPTTIHPQPPPLFHKPFSRVKVLSKLFPPSTSVYNHTSLRNGFH